MRAFLFAIAAFFVVGLANLGFSGAASASCTTSEHVNPTRAEHVIKAEDCLWTTDTRYILFMHKDGTLDVKDERYPGKPVLWQAHIPQPQPGSVAVLMNDGNLVVRSPSGAELWRAPVKSKGVGNYFITLGKKGRVEIYSGSGRSDPNHALVWGSEDNQAGDRNGECQCHITNTDGSPGKTSGDEFSICGLMACRSTCAAKKDYFGDALIGTYKHGSGTCKAF
jgi:hypothetical protein